MIRKLQRVARPSALALVGVAAGVGCTSILGLGGDFTVQGNGGSGAGSTTGSQAGGAGPGGTGGTGTGGNGAAGGGGSAPTMTINGSNIPIYVLPSSEHSSPVNMGPSGGHFVGAIVPGKPVIVGSGLPNGTFTIPDVPVGRYYLNLDTTYFWLDNDGSTPEIGAYVGGRADQTSATASTDTTFDITGLSPWTSTDDVQMVSFEANAATCCGWSLADDATEFDQTVSWRDQVYPFPGHLTEVADSLWFTQLTAKASGAVAYTSADNFAHVPGVNMMDGGSVTFSGAFQPIATMKQTSVTLDVASFFAAIPSVNPQATFADGFHVVDILHTTPDHGPISPSHDLVSTFLSEGQENLSNVTMSYGDPFPASFTEFCFTGIDVTTAYQLPGGTPLNQYARILHQAVLSDCQAGVSLDLSGPGNVKVDGKSFLQDQTLASTTPELTWDAPATGQASHYQIDIGRLYVGNGHTKREVVATILTDETHATMPPSILQSGSTYAFVVTAVSADEKYRTFPTRQGLPISQTPTTSGELTAP